MNRPFFQPRGYHDRDSGGGSAYQQPDFTSDSLYSPLRPQRPPAPQSFHNNNFNNHQHHQGGYKNARGQGPQKFPFRPRGQPFRGGGQGFRGRGAHVPQQSFSRGPRGQQLYAPRHHQQFQQHSQDGNEGKPWMTPELLKMIQERNELGELYSQDQTEENQRLFKVKRIQVNMACNDAKLLYQQKHPNEVQAIYTPYQKKPACPQFVKPTFYCSACDRKVLSQEALDEHNAEHITCKLDGCTYTAHAKLVMNHIELQHSNNLYHRIKGYDTPEEIEKWKEERRMNFPTAGNILRKKTERAEMRDRGETMDLRNEEEEHIFRYKIIPEKRTRSSYKSTTGPDYQSDGDDDIKPKRLKPGHTFETSKSVFATYNKSPIVKLLNYYTDIEVNEHGQLTASTRKTWVPHDDEDIELTNFKKDKDDKEVEDPVEFNITDDEEDFCSNGLTIDENSDKILEPPLVVSANSLTLVPFSTVKFTASSEVESPTDKQKPCGLLGLVSYDSDSNSADEDFEEGEVDNDSVVDNVESKLENGHPNQSSLKVDNVDKEVTPLTDDDEAPEELSANISKSNLEDNQPYKPLPKPTAPVVEPTPEKYVKRPRRPRRKMATEPEAVQKFNQKVPTKYTLLQRLLAPDIRQERNLILQACRYIVDKNFFDETPDTLQNSEVEKAVNNEKEADVPKTN